METAHTKDVDHSDETVCCPVAKRPKLSKTEFYGSSKATPSWRMLKSMIDRKAKQYDLLRKNAENLAIYEEFFKQEEAFQFAATRRGCQVFAIEVNDTGARRFVVSTYEEFYRSYIDVSSSKRHGYEVIREGAVCWLYFDIEYQKEYNTHTDGSLLMSALIGLLSEYCNTIYGFTIPRHDVIDLDSSTDTKFSRHLIVRLSGSTAAFHDNIQAGNFVLGFAATLWDRKGSDDVVNKLFVHNDKGQDVLAIDLGVYTRNRCFRLFMSSKYGKTKRLELSTDNQYVFSPSTRWQIFLDSLICNVPSSVRVLTCAPPSTINGVPYRPAAAARLTATAAGSSSTREGLSGGSPYPKVDEFVLTLCNEGGVQGEIRSWMYFSSIHRLVYSIVRNRWCWRIGRSHRSNGVLYVVDLERSIAYQKCLDPECKLVDYRGPEQFIPPYVMEVEDSAWLQDVAETMPWLEAIANDALEDSIP
eukprot:GILK01010295.1.p2 GENE.GILK01010295.1~~GILK01010295.1.p2  ORF type:complete len:481 (-),score=59.64 GILK01010295.1:1918-3333(-)